MADIIDPNRIPGLAEVDELLLAQERARHKLACNAAALAERAAVVADLRREGQRFHERASRAQLGPRLAFGYMSERGRLIEIAEAFDAAADRIERGEHHRQRGGEGGDGNG